VIEGENSLTEGITFATTLKEEEQEPTHILNPISPPQKKKYCGVKESDPFSSRSPDKLCAFIFQYQIYFQACKGEFNENIEKVFFAISYLRGVALDYFELFINKPDLYQNLDFLEN